MNTRINIQIKIQIQRLRKIDRIIMMIISQLLNTIIDHDDERWLFQNTEELGTWEALDVSQSSWKHIIGLQREPTKVEPVVGSWRWKGHDTKTTTNCSFILQGKSSTSSASSRGVSVREPLNVRLQRLLSSDQSSAYTILDILQVLFWLELFSCQLERHLQNY